MVIRKQKGKGKGKKQRRRFRVQWREPKLLIVFVMDEKGRMKRGSRPWIDGTFQGPDECMELVALHLHRLGAAEAEVVTFSGGRRAVDLGAAGVGRAAAGPAAGKGRAGVGLVSCSASCEPGVGGVGFATRRTAALVSPAVWPAPAGASVPGDGQLSLLAESQPPQATVWTPIRYLEAHAEAGHLRYGYFRSRGVALGSGAIESAIRRVVNLRLKGPGLLWEEANAEGMLVVRAAVLTERWQETLQHVEESDGDGTGGSTGNGIRRTCRGS